MMYSVFRGIPEIDPIFIISSFAYDLVVRYSAIEALIKVDTVFGAG
jgi:hypothetical protein